MLRVRDTPENGACRQLWQEVPGVRFPRFSSTRRRLTPSFSFQILPASEVVDGSLAQTERIRMGFGLISALGCCQRYIKSPPSVQPRSLSCWLAVDWTTDVS